MTPKESRFHDRSQWAAGPGLWDNEPDRIEWRHLGFPCLIVRGPAGALCGYVGLPPEHPMHGVSDSDVRLSDGEWPEVHGGLTYSAPCQGGGNICHVARKGEPDDVWWIGFDCHHCGDFAPKYKHHGYAAGETYRDVDYVRRQVESLAAQMVQQ